MVEPLNNAQLRHLKALGQKLEPVLVLGRAGLSEGFLKSLDEVLGLHELIKVKLGEFKDQKKEMSQTLAEKGQAHLVHLVGHVVVLYRQQPDAAKRKIHF